jgi:23S rRNA pseudouridine1911/1915/1917 synthase
LETLRVEDGVGERLDAWLSSHLGISRTRAASLVEEGAVSLASTDRALKKSEPVERDATFLVRIPAPQPIAALPEDLPLDIVYEDAALLVVNKPAGLVVHPAPGHRAGTLVNALLHHVDDLSGIGGRLRPGIVHRLDRDTSGLLVVAKHDEAHQKLSEQLKERRVRRLYLALAWGHLQESPLTVDAPIGRDPTERKRMAVVEAGRRAVTRMRVRSSFSVAELLEVALGTGRTHQIRVHLAHEGHPVVGDSVYGAGWERGFGGDRRGVARELALRAKRQLLHATALEFDHPTGWERMRFDAPLPEDFSSIVSWLEGIGR